MRLIDADALKKKKRFDNSKQKYIVWMTDVYNAPSIEIVRCKECKHWQGESEHYKDREYKKCYQLCGWYMNSDFWCKYGERRE